MIEGTGSTKVLKEKSLGVITLQEKPRGVAAAGEPESGPTKLERSVQEAKHTVLCRSWQAACLLIYAYSRFIYISDQKVNSKKILPLTTLLYQSECQQKYLQEEANTVSKLTKAL